MDSETADLCPVAAGLQRVGDAWSMLVLRDAGRGTTRYDQFRTSLGISPNILASRLAALVEAGLLERRRYSERPPRDEYVLTPAGRGFLAVLAVLGEWARRQPGGDKLAHFVDLETGRQVRPALVDAETGESLVGRNLGLSLEPPAGEDAEGDAPGST